ncbi:MAG: tRNA (adenosine(37)-N6)-threonylcarbamoyltransferase complex dimerization subunit type 1 TsaB, partial [Bacteroidales bacterium]|nr:tRNA (adenosine(37)-N6)-threonylcarbamoyltransferase complex dimerization subunit type 1 TsaB [Bacteroidales bacterium]
VGTLDTLVYQAADEGLLPDGCRHVVPMVDARRMEVYTAVFTPDGRQLTDTRPQVIEPDSFADLLAEGPVLFIGDGADKCRETLTHSNACFVQCCPKASAMLRPAFAAWNEKRFEDTAYFEPFYLKEFIATVPRNKVF